MAERLTEMHIVVCCRPGSGADTCRYLAVGAGGWTCLKLTEQRAYLDHRVATKTFTAHGDNCDGRTGPCDG